MPEQPDVLQPFPQRPQPVDADGIPDWDDRSHTGLARWWQTMAARRLAFYPGDAPEQVFNLIDGAPRFTPAACHKLRALLAEMMTEHGVEVYQVAEQEVLAALGRQETTSR